LSTSFAFAQNSNAELDSLIVKGIANKRFKSIPLQVDKYEANIKSAYTFEKQIFIIITMKIICPIINS
jgi:cobalt-zinc-cadmium resistance protein CzcA